MQLLEVNGEEVDPVFGLLQSDARFFHLNHYMELNVWMHDPLGHLVISQELWDSCIHMHIVCLSLQHEMNAPTTSSPAIPRLFGSSKQEVKEIYTCRYILSPFSKKIPGMHVNILWIYNEEAPS